MAYYTIDMDEVLDKAIGERELKKKIMRCMRAGPDRRHLAYTQFLLDIKESTDTLPNSGGQCGSIVRAVARFLEVPVTEEMYDINKLQ